MIKIYGTPDCSSCKQAINVCTREGLEYRYIDMMEDPKIVDALVAYIGTFRSVPQILVDAVHVGGLEGFVNTLKGDSYVG